MELRRLGRTDLQVPPICLGAMMFGDQIDEPESHRQLDACFERGVNFIDTAEMYTIPPKPETQGESERIIGRWVSSRRVREKVIIASKVIGRSGFTYLRNGAETRLTRNQIFTAIERSLQNLQTDYIDLYQTHWPDRRAQMFGSSLYGYVHYDEPGAPIEETLGALDELVKQGKIRHAGVSNETPYGVMRHLQSADKNDLPRIVTIQNAYNLLNRTFENGLAEIALEEHVGLLAYSPIAQGVLTGKYLQGAKPKGSRGELFGRLGRYEKPGADDAIEHYLNLAKQFDLSPAVFAMAFVTSRPFVTSNIFGANGESQLDQIFQSLNVDWTEEMEKAVNEVFARFQSPCP
ncbi:MAG: aldo/keto reductase [Pseudomonadota bacterium]